MTRHRLSTYPTLPAIRRELARAKELGLDPVGYEVAPGGTIRILDARAFAGQPQGNPVDDWFKQDQKA